MNNVVSRFVGGSPVTVLPRLIVVPFVVGFLLETFGFDPVGLLNQVVRAARHIIEFGLTDVRQLGRYGTEFLPLSARVALPTTPQAQHQGSVDLAKGFRAGGLSLAGQCEFGEAACGARSRS